MAPTPPSSSTTRTPAARASRRRSRRTRCRNSRWFPRTTRPNTAAPWAASSTPSPRAAPTSCTAPALVLPQHRVQRARSVQHLRSLGKRQQVGGTLGGPIKKDKLFYFLNTDVTRRNFPMTSQPQHRRRSMPPRRPGTFAASRTCARPAGRHPRAVRRHQRAAAALLRADSAHAGPGTLLRQAGLPLFRPQHSERQLQLPARPFAQRHPDAPSPPPAAPPSPATATTPLRCAMDRLAWTSVPTSSFVNELRFGLATDRQADTFDSAELGRRPGYLQVFGQRHPARAGQLPAARRAQRTPLPVPGQRHLDQRHSHHQVRRRYRDHRRLRLLHQHRFRQLHLPDGQRVRAGLLRQHHRHQVLESYSQTFGNPVLDYQHQRLRLLPARPVARHPEADRELRRALRIREVAAARASATRIIR